MDLEVVVEEVVDMIVVIMVVVNAMDLVLDGHR